MKGIPLVTVVNEQIGGDKYEPSSEAIVIQGTVCTGIKVLVI